MSILKNNNADTEGYLKGIIKDFYTMWYFNFRPGDSTLFRDCNNVPIHINDLVWTISPHELFLVCGFTKQKVRLKPFYDSGWGMKSPSNLVVVSVDEVKKITEKLQRLKEEREKNRITS